MWLVSRARSLLQWSYHGPLWMESRWSCPAVIWEIHRPSANHGQGNKTIFGQFWGFKTKWSDCYSIHISVIVKKVVRLFCWCCLKWITCGHLTFPPTIDTFKPPCPPVLSCSSSSSGTMEPAPTGVHCLSCNQFPSSTILGQLEDLGGGVFSYPLFNGIFFCL